MDAEVIQIKKGAALPNITNGNFNATPFDISIADLVGGVKIYDYNKKQNIIYTDADIKYSLSDNKGRKLSKEQQDYFKDSKVRDENGSLKVMYHGTPDGEFNVFKDGTYFTENKEYADRYQNPSASNISSGKQATNPKTFEVYLDIKNPFDLS